MSKQHLLYYMRASADTGHPHVRCAADKPWCSGHQDSCSVAVVCCTSRLISDAHRLRSTRLFATWGRPPTRDTRTCGCLHELGWPSLVMRHLPQPSERVLIWRAANCSKYHDHIPMWIHTLLVSKSHTSNENNRRTRKKFEQEMTTSSLIESIAGLHSGSWCVLSLLLDLLATFPNFWSIFYFNASNEEQKTLSETLQIFHTLKIWLDNNFQ